METEKIGQANRNSIRRARVLRLNVKLFLTVLLVSLFVSDSFAKGKNNCEGFYDALTKKCVFRLVEKMPTFGDDIMGEHPKQLFYYIITRYKHDYDELQFIFNLQFVIDVDGSVTGVRIYNKKPCDYTVSEKQMISILKSMPKWNPGLHNNKPVPVMISLPINLR